MQNQILRTKCVADNGKSVLHFYAEGGGFFLVICKSKNQECLLDLKQKPCVEYLDCSVYGAHLRIKCCSEDHLALVADVVEPDRPALGW